MALEVTMRASGGNISFGETQQLPTELNAEGVLPPGIHVGPITRRLDGYRFQVDVDHDVFEGADEEAAGRLAGALDRLEIVGGRGIRMFMERCEFVPDVEPLGKAPIERAPSDPQPA